jgi:hypothetical protein
MVKKSIGQSTLEFVIILGVLSFLGMYLAWKMWPTEHGGGTIVNLQNTAETKIGND